MHVYIQRPEDGTGFTGSGVTGYETTNVGARNEGSASSSGGRGSALTTEWFLIHINI